MFTRQWIVANSPGSRANNSSSPGSGKLTEGQLYMSSSRAIRAFSEVEKPFLFPDLAVKAANLGNKKAFNILTAKSENKAFQHQRRPGLAAG